MQAWNTVKVINKDLENFGQSGVVQSAGVADDKAKTPTADVKMESAEGEIITFAQDDLQVLS